jgi:hypothetical protein
MRTVLFEPRKLDRFGLEFSADLTPLAGRSGKAEGIEIFGGTEGVRAETSASRWGVIRVVSRS